jgi:hypothetical protein
MVVNLGVFVPTPLVAFGNSTFSGPVEMPCIHLQTWNLTKARLRSAKTIYLQNLTRGGDCSYSQLITTLPTHKNHIQHLYENHHIVAQIIIVFIKNID